MFIPSRVCLLLHNDTILLAPQASSGRRDQKTFKQCRDKDCHNFNDDIRVETFCRNRAASVLSLIALLPLPFPSPSSLQIGLVRRPESGGAHVRELLRHSTDDVCARGRCDARRSTRYGKMRRWILMASAREMRGAGMIQCDQRSKISALFHQFLRRCS